MQPVEVVAHNTATASTNKIHDDDVARRFGFRGGLVPGVDVYAYLTQPVVAEWGLDWLARGTMHARFLRPVYEGDTVTVLPVGDGRLELRDPAGEVCATAEAVLPDAAEPVDLDRWPVVAPAADPPPASPEALAPGTVLGLDGRRFHADRADDYLDAVRDPLPVYRDARVAHPGWLLREANSVLARNVRLGPWIHVESTVAHHRLVPDGAELTTRAVVEREWEAKGHRFVALDVVVLADGEPAARIAHTAIHTPRAAP